MLADNRGEHWYKHVAWTEAIYVSLGGRRDPELLASDPAFDRRWKQSSILGLYYCPGYGFEQRYRISYFYNSLANYVEPANKYGIENHDEIDPRRVIDLRKTEHSSAFILIGDCGSEREFRVRRLNWDRDCAWVDCLPWPTQEAKLRPHSSNWNVLFGDGHVSAAGDFQPRRMTYAYDRLGVDYDTLSAELPRRGQ